MRASIHASLPVFAAAFALASSACATANGYTVSAKVRTLQPGARDAAGISSVGGASVALDCPDASVNRALGKTDREGALRIEGDGAIPLACKLDISADGYKPVALAVASVCTEQSQGACRTLAVHAMMSAVQSQAAR